MSASNDQVTGIYKATILMCTYVDADQVQWGALCECLPWEEGERAEELRRSGASPANDAELYNV